MSKVFGPDKDPNEVFVYTFDWSAELATGETISSVINTVDNGLVLDAESNTTTTSTVRISAGNLGSTASVVAQITTSNSQILRDRVLFPIVAK